MGERVLPRLEQEAPPGRITRTSAKGLCRKENTLDRGAEMRYMGVVKSRPMEFLNAFEIPTGQWRPNSAGLTGTFL